MLAPSLPPDMLEEIMLHASPPELSKICSSNKQARQICSNDNFWHKKSSHDYGDQISIGYNTYQPYYGNWHQYYVSKYKDHIPLTIYLGNSRVIKQLYIGNLNLAEIMLYFRDILKISNKFIFTDKDDKPLGSGIIYPTGYAYVEAIMFDRLPIKEPINIYVVNDVPNDKLFLFIPLQYQNEYSTYAFLRSPNPKALTRKLETILNKFDPK